MQTGCATTGRFALRDVDRPLRRRLFRLRRRRMVGEAFRASSHLLSVTNNWRLRVRVFAGRRFSGGAVGRSSSVPAPTGSSARPSICTALSSRATRPAPHPHRLRLRRSSVPQGFPDLGLRRDALRPGAARVIYQPVTIEPRENTPRIVREEIRGRRRMAEIRNYTLNFGPQHPRRRTACCASCSNWTASRPARRPAHRPAAPRRPRSWPRRAPGSSRCRTWTVSTTCR